LQKQNQDVHRYQDELKRQTVGEVNQLKGDSEAMGNKCRQNIHNINVLRTDVTDMQNNNVGRSGGRNGGDRFNEILECKSISNLKMLGSNKSEFRVWNERLKIAFNQTRKSARKVLDWASDVTTNAVSREAYEVEELNKNTNGELDKHMQYDTFSEDLFSVLYEKCEGDALLKVQSVDMSSEEKGLVAYKAIHAWFTQTTGLAISHRMQYIMSPPRAKKDEDIAQAVEKWEREVTELERLEPEDGKLTWGMKITALKLIITDKIKEHVDFKETEMRSKGIKSETLYKQMKEEIMRWAVQKRLEKTRSKDDMEIGEMQDGVEATWTGQEEWGQEQEWDWDNTVYNVGKGKYGGGKGKGKYGGGKYGGKGNWQEGKNGWHEGKNGWYGGKKGKGKEKGEPAAYQPFAYACHGCGVIGHRVSQCPEAGKGFQGTCCNCGLKGHSANMCPTGSKNGGKKGKAKGNIHEVGEKSEEKGKGDAGVQEITSFDFAFKGNYGGNVEAVEANTEWEEVQRKSNRKMPQVKRWMKKSIEGVTCSNRFEDLMSIEECSEEGSVNEVIIEDIRWREEHEGGWERIKITVDSGAVDSVAPNTIAASIPVKPTAASSAGINWRAANGTEIHNEGGKDIVMYDEQGYIVGQTFQIGAVQKPLASVRKICSGGNRVVFDNESSYVENKKTGKRTEIVKEGGTYAVIMWVKGETDKSKGNIMEVDGIAKGFARQDVRRL